MTKYDLYSKLTDKVQHEGGYISFPGLNVKTVEKEELTVCAIFEGTDESSPLRFVTDKFIAYDVYDYLSAKEIKNLLSNL